MTNQIRLYRSGGINWNWYLCGEFNDVEKTVTIFFHDRWHKFDTERMISDVLDSKVSQGSFDILETKTPEHQRTAFGVVIRKSQYGKVDTEYLVLNPRQVFNYRDMTPIQDNGWAITKL